ncbi:hypothetical protein Taro_012532 [Colocasia esculenta]|uniref:Calcium-transporting ATPase n=1 Tax=Colocasia esculenta TaxID=4460 RepID=A0A843UFX5_COLES|nr:hypothetical protein [Colocasia esculenta]
MEKNTDSASIYMGRPGFARNLQRANRNPPSSMIRSPTHNLMERMDCNVGDVATFFLRATPSRSLTRPAKRWRTAFTVIYSCRAMLSLAKRSFSGIILQRTSSYTVLDVDAGDVSGDVLLRSRLSLVDPEKLAGVVKEKDLGQLRRLGGVDGVAVSLASGAEEGIGGDAEEVAVRRELFGSNTYTRPPPKGFLWFVWEAFKDPMLAILLVCAVLSLGFGIKEHGVKKGWYDGVSIFVAVFLVVSVSAVSNFRQARRFRELSGEYSNIRIVVVRDGRRQEVSIFDIVVGDVVLLKAGDQVPADGLFLEGHSLHVDESSMTGESDHIAVDARGNPFLISGTKATEGYASMLVTAVGMSTAWGEMMSTVTQESNEPTPLQERLEGLTTTIGKVGTAVAVVVLLALVIRYFTGSTKDENGNREFDKNNTSVDKVVNGLVGIISDAVTIVVVAIPEGLPLAVTLTLAYSMKRMMADKAMVRKLPACETMGSVTTICTDKTGTLTLNQMQVTKAWLGEEEVAGSSGVSQSVLELLHQGVGLNTTAGVYQKPNSAEEPEFSGSPTEKAILSWAVKVMGLNLQHVKKQQDVLHIEPFSSVKKRSGVMFRSRKHRGLGVSVHWKGAAEMILAMCSHCCLADGTGTVEIDRDRRVKLQRIIESMAAGSLRCIAFAYKHLNDDDINVGDEGEVQELQEDGLTLLGVVGLKDPCRPGVRKAVETCTKAGVDVKMITGDNIFTATAIALECGILRPGDDPSDGDAIVEGRTFRGYSLEERMAVVDKIRVMARSSPNDKLLMVQCLKRKTHVVAVTGDGTNDAPALKEADVGLAMGIQGTEVAKESSDIVILDDNFASVVTVLKWGRCVYNNIQKFIQFQLTVNVAALVINFVAAVASGKVPLTTVQMLWVNLIMDTLGALALATEKPTEELLQKSPVGRTAPLITRIMWRNLLAQAAFQISVLLVFHFRGESIFGVGEKVKNTLVFNTFVLCQVFNEFNARSLEKKNVFQGIHRNRLFLGIIAVTLILQVLMVEFLKKFAGTERLGWEHWGVSVGIAFLSWPIGWTVKCIPIAERPHSVVPEKPPSKISDRLRHFFGRRKFVQN